MKKNNPPIGFTTLPPKTLVRTWISLSKDTSTDMEHVRERSLDVIKLVFGSIDVAEEYLEHENKVCEKLSPHF